MKSGKNRNWKWKKMTAWVLAATVAMSSSGFSVLAESVPEGFGAEEEFTSAANMYDLEGEISLQNEEDGEFGDGEDWDDSEDWDDEDEDWDDEDWDTYRMEIVGWDGGAFSYGEESTRYVTFRLYQNVPDPDEDRKYAEDWKITIGEYDTSLIDIVLSENDTDKIIEITPKKKIGNTTFELTAAVPELDEDGNVTDIWTNVYNNSYSISVVGGYVECNMPKEVSFGETVDLNKLNLKYVEIDPDTLEEKERKDVVFDFDYGNGWDADYHSGKYPVLTRTDLYAEYITVEAWDYDEELLARKKYLIDKIDYRDSFSLDYDGCDDDESTLWIEDTEEKEIRILSDESVRDKIKYDWEILLGTSDDTIKYKGTEETKFWSADPLDPSVLLINGEKLKKAQEDVQEQYGEEGEFWVAVRAYVISEYNPELVSGVEWSDVVLFSLLSSDNCFNEIVLEDAGEILVGEKLDLNDYKLRVQQTSNTGVSDLDGVSFKVNYNAADWEEIETDSLPVLIRKTAEATYIEISAEGNFTEASKPKNKLVNFERVEYDSYFYYELYSSDPSEFWLAQYDTGQNEIILSDNNLKDKNVQIQWEMGYGIKGTENFTAITDKDGYGTLLTVDAETPYVVHVDGETLAQAYEKLIKEKGSEYYLKIKAHVMAGVYEANQFSARLQLYPSLEEYTPLIGDLEFFPGETFHIEYMIHANKQNADYPNGIWKDLPATNATVEVLESEKDGVQPVGVEKHGNYWRFKGNCVGSEKVTVYYQDLSGKEQSFSFTLKGIGQRYDVETNLVDSEGAMLSDDTLEMQVTVWNRSTDEDGLRSKKIVDPKDYHIEIDNEKSSGYGYAIKKVVIKDNKVVLHSVENSDGPATLYFNVVSNEKNADNTPKWECSYGKRFLVYSDEYYVLEGNIPDTEKLAVGEKVDLNSIQPIVYKVSRGKDGTKIKTPVENVQYDVQYDKGCFKAVDVTQKYPVVERLWEGSGWIYFEAKIDEYSFADKFYEFSALCDHQWKETKRTDSTCIKEGSAVYTCQMCGEEKTETLKKAAHKLVTVVDKKATCGTAGKQHQECSVCRGARKELKDIPATGKHKWGSYKVTREATVLKKGKKVRTCKVCKKSDTEEIKTLKPFVKVSASSFPIKRGQTVSIPVTLEKGDSISKVKSSSTKNLTVSVKKTTVKVTANKKAKLDTVKVTITTKAGASKTLSVKIQKSDVAATKISGIPSSAVVKVKKTLKLKPTISPISCVTKVIYKSSDTKVATVSSKGVVTGKKAGKATITVTCGKIKKTCKVTVKK